MLKAFSFITLTLDPSRDLSRESEAHVQLWEREWWQEGGGKEVDDKFP